MNHLLDSLISKAKIDPAPRVYFRICEEYRKNNEYDQVIRYAREGLELDSHYIPLLLAMGRACQETTDFERAVPYYQMVLDLDPGSVRANHGLAWCFIQLGFTGEAQVYIDNLRLLQPEFVIELQDQIAELMNAPSSESSPDFSENSKDIPSSRRDCLTIEANLDVNDDKVVHEQVTDVHRGISKLKKFLNNIRSANCV
jgi:tetratricopeptide (TPR) repeat protein